MTRWIIALSLSAAVLFGALYCHEREGRGRDRHDVIADSLAEQTREAVELASRADSIAVELVTVYRDRWRELPARVDTLRIPVEVRDLLTACVQAVDALEESCARKDTVITALRAELAHAQRPGPPTPRHLYYVRGGRDVLNESWEAEAGATYRLFGSLSAFAAARAGARIDSLGVRRAEPQIIIGGTISWR